MKVRIGLGAALTACLATVISTGGLSASVSGAVGAVFTPCQIATGCAPNGSLTITKKVVGGTATAPWTFDIASTNCTVSTVNNSSGVTNQGGGAKVTATIPAGGGSVTAGPVFVKDGGGAPCQYRIIETTVANWTTKYSPAQLQPISTSNGVAAWTVTNTYTAPAAPPAQSNPAQSNAAQSSSASTTGATASLSPNVTQPGGSVLVKGTGFTPGESVVIDLHSTVVTLTTLVADASGNVSGTVRIPAGTSLGAHVVTLSGVSSGKTASAALQVVLPKRAKTGL